MKSISKMIGCALVAGMLSTTAVAQQTLNEEVLACGISLLDVPYVDNILDEDNEESLVLNTDELDNKTFVEYVLAMALTPKDENNDKDEDVFADYVIKLRYRDGKIDGYTSRLHYLTDWINNAVKAGLLTDITKLQSQYTAKIKTGYMTAHPQQFKHLATSAENVQKMKNIERSLNGTEIHYIPKTYMRDQGFEWIKDGDVIAFTTNADGIDIAMMGFAFNISGKLTLLYASQADKKVVVSKVTITKMLEDNPQLTGIRVLRASK